tara:strand:- start:273 stop:560 length:288 start_codon:yes stop_codon:yes gene_type:complete
MPRSEVWKGDGEKIDEDKVIDTDDNYLESGQRYGIMEDERSISGQKRICFCYGQLCGKLDRWCPIWIMLLLCPIVYVLGFYAGLESNCVCNTTVV